MLISVLARWSRRPRSRLWHVRVEISRRPRKARADITTARSISRLVAALPSLPASCLSDSNRFRLQLGEHRYQQSPLYPYDAPHAPDDRRLLAGGTIEADNMHDMKRFVTIVWLDNIYERCTMHNAMRSMSCPSNTILIRLITQQCPFPPERQAQHHDAPCAPSPSPRP